MSSHGPDYKSIYIYWKSNKLELILLSKRESELKDGWRSSDITANFPKCFFVFLKIILTLLLGASAFKNKNKNMCYMYVWLELHLTSRGNTVYTHFIIKFSPLELLTSSSRLQMTQLKKTNKSGLGKFSMNPSWQLKEKQPHSASGFSAVYRTAVVQVVSSWRTSVRVPDWVGQQTKLCWKSQTYWQGVARKHSQWHTEAKV